MILIFKKLNYKFVEEEISAIYFKSFKSNFSTLNDSFKLIKMLFFFK